MFRLLVLAIALSACVADEEAQPSATPEPIMFFNDQRVHHTDRHHDRSHHDRSHHDRSHHDGGHHVRHHEADDDWLSRRLGDRHADHHDQDDYAGPVILRSIRPHDGHKPDIARQNKIIADVYSPDYAEPTWVLDYRYLKSGGRDYTRGPGGQILILPRGIHTNEPKEFKNYDELIEHLRLKNLAERRKPQYFMPLGEGHHGDGHHDGYANVGHGHDGHGHDAHRGHDGHGRGGHRGHDDHRDGHGHQHAREWWRGH